MKNYTLALALGLASTIATFAAEQTFAFDPITVKPGEEMRITLFNPKPIPITLRVFSYNAVENTYDEGPMIALPPGKLRFFDLKVSKEFVGIGGVIEVVPDAPSDGAEASKRAASPAASNDGKPEIVFNDILVSSAVSHGSLQHRGPSGQTQTMGYSFGASQTGGGWFKSIQQAKRAPVSEWIASAAY